MAALCLPNYGTIIGGGYPLADAAKAHAVMENRKTAGELLLVQ